MLWSAEDVATQRLFEPLEQWHTPEQVFPWLQAMVEAWENLTRAAKGMPWARCGTRFSAHQERFHLSALLEKGITEAQYATLDARLARMGAHGVLLRLGARELERRLEQSLRERPSCWGAWIQRRFGDLEGAARHFLAQQESLLGRAAASDTAWILSELDGEDTEGKPSLLA